MRVIFLNGPPRCGKDTAGELIKAAWPNLSEASSETNYATHPRRVSKIPAVPSKVRVDKFARILKEKAHALYGLWDYVNDGPFAHDYFESRKDEPCEEFRGKTPREIYIAVAEDLIRPMHGRRVFGEMLVEDLVNRSMDVLLLTDSGFREESEVLVEKYGAANCTLIRIQRQGCDFEGDSRSYIDLWDLRVDCFDAFNPEGDLAEFRTHLGRCIPEIQEDAESV